MKDNTIRPSLWKRSALVRLAIYTFGYSTLTVSLILILFNSISSGYREAISIASTTVLTSFFIALLTRIGAIEDRSLLHHNTRTQILSKIDSSTSALAKNLEDFENRGRMLVEDTRKDIVDRTTARFEARYKWGLEKIENDLDEQFGFSDYSDVSIRWINTKFHYSEKRKENIMDAITNGNEVKLLLIHPNCPNAIDRGFYTYSGDDEVEDAFMEAKANYYRELMTCAQTFRGFYNVQKDKFIRESDGKPLFQLRFYDDAPAMPMLLCKNKERLKFGFTGFYLDSFSRSLPYLKWSGRGGNYMTEHLFKYFDRKWTYAERFEADLLDDDFIWPGPNVDHAPTTHQLTETRD